MNKRMLFIATAVCLGTMASLSGAEAMPVASNLATVPALSNGQAQAEKVVLVIRPFARRGPLVRRRPLLRPRPLIRPRIIIR